MAPDVQSIFAQAVEHHQAGRLDKAIACYGQVLALRPDLAGAYHNLGNALCGQGKLEQAETSYRRALTLQPGTASTHNNLGIVLFEQDKLDEAVACYREALAREPDYAEALNNLGAALCRQGELDEGESCIRRALALKSGIAGAHDNLGTLLRDRGKPREAEDSIRRALALAPGFPRALHHLGSLLKDQVRLDEAIATYRQLLQIEPEDIDGLNGLALVLAARGDTSSALETILQSMRIEETASARRIFVDIVKQHRWTSDNREARRAMARALSEPWVRPDELAHTGAGLIMQNAAIGACVVRAAQAWPQPLPMQEFLGPGGPKMLADDELLLALLVSAQNTDIELERFLTMARSLLLEAAVADDPDGAGLEFYAALARQCFINEYVFFHGEEEIQRAGGLRDALESTIEVGKPVSPLQLLAVAAYFPLHSLSGAARLLNRAWPERVTAVLTQQVREPWEEEQLRAAIPRLSVIDDAVSRLVQNQYEENPYPRWVRLPPVEKTNTIIKYLRGKFPLADFQHRSNGESLEFLSAGCGTGQLALEIAQSVTTRVLAIDLSLASLSYAKRKAREIGLTSIEFGQADLVELGTIGRYFDVVECSGALHHMTDPLAGWRVLSTLLKPGGFMLVGLYSEAARRGIMTARQFIARQGYGTSADDIRRCRQDLLTLDQNRELGTAFGDFFGMSSCRDLLFHAHEHQFRIPAIAAFLSANGLTFLGFEMDSATLQAYRLRFPDDPNATNLDHWDVFENDNPDTFARMYVFWMQKSGAA